MSFESCIDADFKDLEAPSVFSFTSALESAKQLVSADKALLSKIFRDYIALLLDIEKAENLACVIQRMLDVRVSLEKELQAMDIDLSMNELFHGLVYFKNLLEIVGYYAHDLEYREDNGQSDEDLLKMRLEQFYDEIKKADKERSKEKIRSEILENLNQHGVNLKNL